MSGRDLSINRSFEVRFRAYNVQKAHLMCSHICGYLTDRPSVAYTQYEM